jgi:hypothetical protein
MDVWARIIVVTNIDDEKDITVGKILKPYYEKIVDYLNLEDYIDEPENRQKFIDEMLNLKNIRVSKNFEDIRNKDIVIPSRGTAVIIFSKNSAGSYEDCKILICSPDSTLYTDDHVLCLSEIEVISEVS